MKTILTLAISIITLFTLGSNFSPVATVDKNESTVSWNAKKVSGEHYGKVAISDANLDYEKGRITGGTFTIDMQSITVEDIKDANSNKRLVDHLRSDDFFSVDKFKNSTFTITEAKSNNGKDYQIKGNLVIKGISNAVEFPAKIEVNGNKLTATGEIVFDRTKYDIKYRSGNYFENLADKLIYDEVALNVRLVAGI